MELIELNRYPLEFTLSGVFVSSSSTDGKIAINTESEVIILKYKPNMKLETNTLSFDEYFVHCSDYHVADKTGIEVEEYIGDCSKEQYYSLVMNEIFTPELQSSNPQVTKAIATFWSPPGIYRGKDNAVAIVSNTGNVEVFVEKNGGFEAILNLTQSLIDLKKEEWTNKNMRGFTSEQKCTEHQTRVLDCAATCMAWSPIYNVSNGQHIYMVVGYLNGTVRIWQYDTIDTIEDLAKPARLVAILEEKFQRVTAVHWSPVAIDKAWVAIGDLSGKVISIFVSFPNKNTLVFQEEVNIWEEEDIRTSRIHSVSHLDRSCFLAIKGAFVIIGLVNNMFKKMIWCDAANFGNLFISGFHAINPTLYLITTYTGILKTFDLNVMDKKCTYQLLEVKNDINWDHHSPHGLVRLPNYMWGVIIYPCKIFDHLSNRTPIEIVFCHQKHLDPGKILKANSNFHLADHWELLDIIRCTSSKENTLPCKWLAKIENYDDIPIYEIRIIYWISTSSYTFRLLHPKTRRLLPIIPEPEVMWDIFFVKYRLERLQNLMSIFEEKQCLNDHQLNSAYMMKYYLIKKINDEQFRMYFSEEYIKEIGDVIKQMDQIENLPIPDCVICDIPLVNGECPNEHPLEQCWISLVQMRHLAKWTCPMCEAVASEDIEDTNPYCPLCDVQFYPYDTRRE